MIDRAFLARIRIESLDRKKHDRAVFSCGEERLDNFLKNMAARQQDDDHTKVYVACLDAKFDIAGFYALNAHAIDATSLPPDQRRKLPAYPTISAIYLSVVAVDADHQSKGLGSFLLADALKRCVTAANQIGAHFIVLDALNERAARLYRKLGFVDLVGHEPRMLIKMAVVRTSVEKSSAPR